MNIMTYEEYIEVKKPTPYHYVLKSSQGNSLYCFGERHSFDPDNQQWQQVKSLWAEFITDENPKKIAFIEGGKRPFVDDEKNSIVRHGGMGLVTYLAHNEGVERYSPEPSEKFERDELLKEYSKDVIQYYYFARVVLQWSRKEEPRPDFTEYIRKYLDRDERVSGWSNFDFSLENMKTIHKAMFGHDFDECNEQFFYDVSNPINTETAINRASRMSSEVRDVYIVSEIEKYIKEGYSIYVQYGATHVVMWEPLLRELID